MQAHLEWCPDCAEELDGLKALRVALQRSQLAHAAPAALREKIQSSMSASTEKESSDRRIKWPSFHMEQLAGAFALLALISVSAWQWTAHLQRPSGEQRIAAEVFSSHVRSLEGDHLMDVISAGQHTVKPWFDGKLDFSPPVEDLASDGFPLMGGRLDYLEGHQVAALIYQRRKHFVNVFVWPDPARPDSNQAIQPRQGYNMMRWSRGGFEFWAVSHVGASDLGEFVGLLKTRISSESK